MNSIRVASVIFTSLFVVPLLVITGQDNFRNKPDRSGSTEAPAGFDNLTNGMTPQGPSFQSLTEDNVVPLRSFNDSRFDSQHLLRLCFQTNSGTSLPVGEQHVARRSTSQEDPRELGISGDRRCVRNSLSAGSMRRLAART